MRVVLVPVVLAVFTGCSPRTTTIGTLDAGSRAATLTITGRVCTEVPDPTEFRTRLVFVLEQSGSMCVTDPPGAQATPGFCETIAVPPGQTEPRRVTALKDMLNTLPRDPNINITLVPYGTNVMGLVSSNLFDPQIRVGIDTLQSGLGNASDLQGALEATYSLIESEVFAHEASEPEVLPRSRYVVVVLTDGAPFPRCSANDALSVYADDLHPELTWPDSTSYCNTATLGDPDGINGFTGGRDRNQNAQLFDLVDRLRALRTTHHIGDVQLHTTMLFNDDAIADCGAACLGLWGTRQRWPGPVVVPQAENPAFAKAEGRWLMRELAAHGGGNFTEFIGRTAIGNMTVGTFDATSLAAPNVLKKFFAQPLRAARLEGEWRPDQDGDGVIDDLEADAGTSPLALDSDGDGFDDRFEFERRDAGFDALVKDLRGCDPARPQTIGCVSRDIDGDGLSQYAEAYLNTMGAFADTDRDGFPDGFEIRHGFDPLVALDPSTDSDSDGLTDAQELSRGSDPKRADRTFADSLGMETALDEHVQPDGSRCYDYTASNLPLAAAGTSSTDGGFNLFKLWFAGAPEGVREDLGTWSAACAWSQKNSAVSVPANLVQVMPETSFGMPGDLADPYIDFCLGAPP
ncbi:MAG: VWA domain-containing protein [Myxococcales bacterium]|nr:VWA domain-containing protein [Myxococcales bacterium]